MTGRHGHRIIGTENRLAVTGKKPVALLAADIQGQMVAVASRRKARTSPANLLATDKSNLVLMGKPNARLAIAIEQGQAILDNLGPPGPIAKAVLSDHAMASACPPTDASAKSFGFQKAVVVSLITRLGTGLPLSKMSHLVCEDQR